MSIPNNQQGFMNEYQRKQFIRVIDEIMKNPLAEEFIKPIDRRVLPEYFETIKRPMCLQNLQFKLKDGRYPTVESFLDDVSLIWSNARIYNGEDSAYGRVATYLENEMKKRFSKVAPNEIVSWVRKVQKATEEFQKSMKILQQEIS